MSRLLAKTSITGKSKVVATITHGKVKRTNVPRAEHQAVMAEDDCNPNRYLQSSADISIKSKDNNTK